LNREAEGAEPALWRPETLSFLVLKAGFFFCSSETFEKCSILVKFKEGENFNHRNTLSILRIEI